jgi:tetrahydromethanopterin S-methyltransferase subunit G
MMSREKRTDERLDDLNKKVDKGFEDVRAEMRAGFDRVHAEFGELHRILYGGLFVIIAAMIGSNIF